MTSVGVRVPRFFEFQLSESNSTLDYDTTTLAEDPMYVQFNAYWNELLVTGLLPFTLLIIMNFCIYLKIRASSNFSRSFETQSSHKSLHSFKKHPNSKPTQQEHRLRTNNYHSQKFQQSTSCTSTSNSNNREITVTGIELSGILYY